MQVTIYMLCCGLQIWLWYPTHIWPQLTIGHILGLPLQTYLHVDKHSDSDRRREDQGSKCSLSLVLFFYLLSKLFSTYIKYVWLKLSLLYGFECTIVAVLWVWV